MKNGRQLLFSTAVLLLSLVTVCGSYAQDIRRDPNRKYRIENGVLTEIIADSTSVAALADSTGTGADSTAVVRGSSGEILEAVDMNETGGADTTILTKAQEREQRKLERRDTSYVRYSKLFRDTIPISRMAAISAGVPGFAQLYNKQVWKIPILYGAVGATAYLGFKQNSKYKTWKKQYDDLIFQQAQTGENGPKIGRDQLDPVQSEMIKYNNRRTLLLAGALATYIYFIGDGVLNYNGPASNSIKMATTLSTICPGAGQMYNKSYWKVPIVVGAFASVGYVIDFNTRGYNRMKRAYDIRTNGGQDEFYGVYSESDLKSLKNSYRRNRDLSYIITAGVYILNIIDAHVDAHLKDYDISDDLSSVSFQPAIIDLMAVNSPNANAYGMALKFNF